MAYLLKSRKSRLLSNNKNKKTPKGVFFAVRMLMIFHLKLNDWHLHVFFVNIKIKNFNYPMPNPVPPKPSRGAAM